MSDLAEESSASPEVLALAEQIKAVQQRMTAHREGAVTASQTELAEGQSAEAEGLAREIIDGQEAEVAEMQALLD